MGRQCKRFAFSPTLQPTRWITRLTVVAFRALAILTADRDVD